MQIVLGYFGFADNASKHTVEALHQLGLLVSYETIRRALKVNAVAIKELAKRRILEERFFISYDNMNFYEHIRDQRLHNKGHQVNYTAGYLCFMPTDNSNPETSWEDRYLDANQVNYNAVNDLTMEDFVLGPEVIKHCARSVQYILSNIFARHFPRSLFKQKVMRNGHLVSKYLQRTAPLDNIQCRMEKADIIPLPTFGLDKASIAGTIDILRSIAARLGLENFHIEDKKIMVKGDYLTVRNITRTIYRLQEEITPINRFQWL